MIVQIELNGEQRSVDFNQPIDISIPLRSGADNVNAFHIDPPRFEPFRAGEFVGSVAQGGPVNCENLFINAHGHGTHTECVGHIAAERITINQCLKQFMFAARLITVSPQQQANGDMVVLRSAIESQLQNVNMPSAVIVRASPNNDSKLSRQWSGNNPGYFEPSALEFLRAAGVEHILIDLPSVDREEDGGALAAHHVWWNYPQAPRLSATITEMIYVPDAVADGEYLLNIQIASLESDASPSKPVLYVLGD